MVVVREGDENKSEVEVSGQPPRWSRDLSEYFVVVGSSKLKVFDGAMSVRGGNHAATFFCLDRVITF